MQADMGNDILRSAAFGGYDKADVIAVLDTLNLAKLSYEEGAVPLAELKRTADKIAAHKFKKVVTGGFNKQDVENYFRKLCDDIQNMTE